MNFLFYAAAFGIALGILIVVHEFGHFAVARWCGVKVLRFSVGFGRPIVSRRFGRDGTEWALGAFPLGGYVKMLDEREGEVPTDELHRAFNRQAVAKRFAIVAAGPIANFLLAIVLYWALFVHGVEELRPLLAAPPAQSVAAQAGFGDGELVRGIGGKPIATWQDFRWEMLHQALERNSVSLEVQAPGSGVVQRTIDFSATAHGELEEDFLERLGFRLYRPRLPPVIGAVSAGTPAQRAGVQAGDRIVSVNGRAVNDWSDFVTVVRDAPGRLLQLQVDRAAGRVALEVVPAEAEENGQRIGRIGVAAQEGGFDRARLFAQVRYDPLSAFERAVRQTWSTSAFTLAAIGRMVSGQLSWRNLSGPVTIADYAGQSAKLGVTHYLKFLALISISLGVLNLLPIPLLDGGHLMYYIVEIIKGGPVSERAMEIGQQIGLAVLVMLMAFAFYNDINRLISS